MVELKILSGNKAGTSWVTRRFPVRIGRSAQSDLRLDDAGVWDQHLRLDLRRGEGFVLRAETDALATINSQTVAEPILLRNGDRIAIGAARLQFWLASPRQRGLAFREWLTWLGIGVVTLSQLVLIYFVLD